MHNSHTRPLSEIVPLKKCGQGEEYTKAETESLRAWWSANRVVAVAEWIDAGATADDRPDCVGLIEERRGTRLPEYDLRGLDLKGKLTSQRDHKSPKPDLRRAHLEHAYLAEVRLEYADLRDAHLQHASLASAHVDHADLRRADLTDANLPSSLLTNADIRGTDFTDAFVRDTDLRNVQWRPERTWDIASLLEKMRRRMKGGKRDFELFEGVDLRGIHYSDWLFGEFLRQAEFIRGRRAEWGKAAFAVWWVTCDCGRSIWRWLAWCATVIVIFGALFAWSQGWETPLVQPDTERLASATRYTPFYFSIVTFSTLGFGDVTPCRLAGEIVVTLEVLFGYVMLGGLISIFTMKFVPPR